MPQTIDFDSVRTHAHAISTMTFTCTATAIYAFHAPHAKVIPFVVLTSVLVCSGLGLSTTYLEEHTSTQLALCQMKRNSVLCGLIWCGWLVYGSIWEEEHRLGGRQDLLCATIWLLSGIWCTLRIHRRRPVHYTGVLVLQTILLYLPLESSVAQYLPAWNVLIRVVLFGITYFFNLYVRLATQQCVDSANSISTSLWILFVNKWMLPVIAIHWMVQLHSLSRCYSQRPRPKHKHKPGGISRSISHQDALNLSDLEDPVTPVDASGSGALLSGTCNSNSTPYEVLSKPNPIPNPDPNPNPNPRPTHTPPARRVVHQPVVDRSTRLKRHAASESRRFFFNKPPPQTQTTASHLVEAAAQMDTIDQSGLGLGLGLGPDTREG